MKKVFGLVAIFGLVGCFPVSKTQPTQTVTSPPQEPPSVSAKPQEPTRPAAAPMIAKQPQEQPKEQPPELVEVKSWHVVFNRFRENRAEADSKFVGKLVRGMIYPDRIEKDGGKYVLVAHGVRHARGGYIGDNGIRIKFDQSEEVTKTKGAYWIVEGVVEEYQDGFVIARGVKVVGKANP